MLLVVLKQATCYTVSGFRLVEPSIYNDNFFVKVLIDLVSVKNKAHSKIHEEWAFVENRYEGVFCVISFLRDTLPCSKGS